LDSLPRISSGQSYCTPECRLCDSGDRISVNYVLRKTPEGWKAYDVNIDGISYVKSYREDFGSQIQQQGIDSVIARLERGEKPSEISKTTKATGSKS